MSLLNTFLYSYELVGLIANNISSKQYIKVKVLIKIAMHSRWGQGLGQAEAPVLLRLFHVSFSTIIVDLFVYCMYVLCLRMPSSCDSLAADQL